MAGKKDVGPIQTSSTKYIKCDKTIAVDCSKIRSHINMPTA